MSSWVRARSLADRVLLSCMKKQEKLTTIGTDLCTSAVASATPLDYGEGINRINSLFIHPSIYHLLNPGTVLSPEEQKRDNSSPNPQILGFSYGDTGNINPISPVLRSL